MSKQQIDRKTIEKSLCKKGFVKEEGDHRYYYHEVDGKRTGPYAKISKGTQYKTYHVSLINFLKMQLCLKNLKDAFDLLQCPMSGTEYIENLKKNGLI